MNKRDQRVYDYMIKNGSITVKECSEYLGTSECRKIISDMQKKGIKIKDEWQEGTNKFGEKTRFKRYYLDEQ